MRHEITRVRQEPRRRSLIVDRTEYVTPGMLRLRLVGDALDDFQSLAPDDHIKVFARAADGSVERRDYTPRRFDAATRSLSIDFALHEAGPITAWARRARPGDTAEIGGPRGSVIVPYDFDWWLLIGDETALPAIGRRLEEAPVGSRLISIVSVTGPQEEQSFQTRAEHRAQWVHRPSKSADDPEPLLAALRDVALPAGEGFVWIAAEGRVARSLRAYVLEEMRHPPQWLKAGGYWLKGQTDSHEKFEG